MWNSNVTNYKIPLNSTILVLFNEIEIWRKFLIAQVILKEQKQLSHFAEMTGLGEIVDYILFQKSEMCQKKFKSSKRDF